MTERETPRIPSEALTMAEEMMGFVRARGEEPEGVNGQPTLRQVLMLQTDDVDEIVQLLTPINPYDFLSGWYAP